MDSWIAIVAGVAGYLAKRWHSSAKDKQVSLDYPFLTRKHQDNSVPGKQLTSEERISQDSYPSEVIVRPPCDNKQQTDIIVYKNCDLDSILSLMPPYSKTEEIKESLDEFKRENADLDQKSSRSRRSSLQLIRPLSSMESCLEAAQFCKRHKGMENHFPYSPAPLRKSGSFSRKSGDSLQNLHKQKSPLGQETTLSLLPLSNVGSVEAVRNKEAKKLDTICVPETGENSESSNLLPGYSEAAVIFGLGVSMGLISSFIVNNQELNKLNGLLKQTENLVQDLQEELELKDSMIVKELAMEDQDSKAVHEQKTEDHSEVAMSKIEAELQAELQWLELNVGYSNPQAKSPHLDENQDLIPGLAEGELREEIFGVTTNNQAYADQDGSGASTPYTANYAVSPRELSLRLHKVIESRLEERISELETALECSVRKVKSLKPDQHEISLENDKVRPFSWCWDYSSPIMKKENGTEQASVISISEEEECMKMKNDTESSPHDVDGWHDISFGDELINICFPDDESLHEHEDDEENEDEDERSYEDLMIIKQIVEKTRKDSSALLNAKKVLFSMDQT